MAYKKYKKTTSGRLPKNVYNELSEEGKLNFKKTLKKKAKARKKVSEVNKLATLIAKKISAKKRPYRSAKKRRTRRY